MVLEAWAEAEMIVSVEATEAGVVILETTPLMEDAMIGTTIMDHLETALAMADLTDPEEAWIEDLDLTIPEVDQCFPNLGAALIILATMDLVT